MKSVEKIKSKTESTQSDNYLSQFGSDKDFEYQEEEERGRELKCYKITRKLFFLHNLIMFGCGVFFLLIGVWISAYEDGFNVAITSDPGIVKGVYIILIASVLFLVIGFLGCYGASEDEKFMLAAFFNIVMILALSKIVLSISLPRNYVNTKEKLMNSTRLYEEETARGYTIAAAWNAVQRTFDCCGVDGIGDWIDKGIQHPPPPCTRAKPIRGCEEAIVKYRPYILGVFSLIIAIENISLIAACILWYQKDDFV